MAQVATSPVVKAAIRDSSVGAVISIRRARSSRGYSISAELRRSSSRGRPGPKRIETIVRCRLNGDVRPIVDL